MSKLDTMKRRGQRTNVGNAEAESYDPRACAYWQVQAPPPLVYIDEYAILQIVEADDDPNDTDPGDLDAALVAAESNYRRTIQGESYPFQAIGISIAGGTGTVKLRVWVRSKIGIVNAPAWVPVKIVSIDSSEPEEVVVEIGSRDAFVEAMEGFGEENPLDIFVAAA
jgi:hypothetical protein